MLSLVWLMLLAYSSLANTQILSQDNNSTSNGKNIFILSGQSNMSGRGGVINDTWDGYIPLDCYPDRRILRLTANNEWDEAREPLHRDIDVNKTCGIGPGLAFANSVLDRYPGLGTIGLVPCAIGGTKISEWRRGSRLYNMLLSRGQSALVEGGGMIRAVLWYQGESDTESHEDARLYKVRLEKFFTDLRSDLLSPALPIIQVGLASGSGPYIEIVRKAQLGIQLPDVRCVDAKGSQLEPDGLHLTAAAQVRLGKRLADAFLQMMAPLPVQSSAHKRVHNFFLDFLLKWIR